MYYIIVNPGSRSMNGRGTWDIVRAELDSRGIPYKKFYTRYPGHTPTLVRQICRTYEGPKTILFLGGDGTINEVYNGIPEGADVTLGYIPAGSGNDFAGSLGIPNDPLEALRRILDGGTVHYLDAGTVTMNGETRRFAGSSGIGYDAEVCRQVMTSPLKKYLNSFGLGKLIYLVIALKSFFSFPRQSVTVIEDGGPAVTYPKAIFICPMNTAREGGGMIMAPAARADDGKLTVCTYFGMSRLRALTLLPLTYLGRHIGFSGTRQKDCETVEIRCNAELPVHVDGEFIGFTNHAVFRISHNSVRVIY